MDIDQLKHLWEQEEDAAGFPGGFSDKHKKKDCNDNCFCKDHKSCICSILGCLEKSHKPFRFRTKTGDDIIAMIKCFDKCTGCVVLIQPEMNSPKLPAVAVIISCLDIESISFEIDDHKD
ncbi:hypothetical protein [Bacillus sp. B-jedd]|uniref:hypothetical protein n=1 Tax=Bacillus sp. B-jedd TaxID=1476857 RepID=UPI0005156257|nr:hypothetical protein [Bacillus sp. B-jedd]CEG25512.1 hypothetical protein BN1002_00324 [Bacillus sp. B-jedd]